MKYLVLLVVLIVAIGIWRKRRDAEEDLPRPAARKPLSLPQDMLACAHCGMHVPQSEALVQGPHAYCCGEHQRRGPV
jgi:uncharacterized protein